MKMPSSDNLSEPDNFNLLKHLKQPPIKASYDVLHSQDDELLSYLQNEHPMAKGKHIINYWKVRVLSLMNAGETLINFTNFPASDCLWGLSKTRKGGTQIFKHSGVFGLCRMGFSHSDPKLRLDRIPTPDHFLHRCLGFPAISHSSISESCGLLSEISQAKAGKRSTANGQQRWELAQST
ncbi:hypothetical protein O181_078868 [Austropuccinia psidii MF-1]|uniref:Uncharacterized protein n=1 Tax=Austropuccinia psidii MF-1 TaxID=1389203 RepID=A0A9Q3IF18_9BASI|nr:hypothetical protein [Austropuccinia psidii MF-1]